jgi:hypothetical protein
MPAEQEAPVRAALEAASSFSFAGRPLHAVALRRGRIHESFVVTTGGTGAAPTRYLLQRLNTAVFPDVGSLMANVVRVSAQVRRRLPTTGARPGRTAPSVGMHEGPLGQAGGPLARSPRLVAARRGGYLVSDASGTWRAFSYVERARPPGSPPTPREAEAAGFGFGSFLTLLDGMPGPPLAEVIPGFHDLDRRTSALAEAARRDPCGRSRGARGALDEAMELLAKVQALSASAGAGRLPRRLVHNDAKLDNVLLDVGTGEAVAVVDLDTVMPGSVLSDVGDLLRSASATVGEDDPPPPPPAPVADLRRLRSALVGWLDATSGLVTDEERAALPAAGPMLALEQAVRFLADHLEGDHYFPVTRPSQNLDRARNQLRLCGELLAAADLVADLVARSTP